ncbi:MAG: hypothetical protein OMM_10367, partial [Candidatus Magnetoglobus multicellularis str. Araruama]
MGSGEFLNGQLDEVRIWNYARSASQVKETMCQKLSGSETGLVAYYRFDHISGTTLKDLSGNNYDGTLTNMDNSNWVTSGASLGYTSVYDYSGSNANDYSVTLSSSDSDQMTITGGSGTFTGLQLYMVNTSPNNTNLPSSDWASFDSHYWGVYTVGSDNIYTLTYNYSGNDYVSNENKLSLAGRNDNSASLWSPINSILNTESNLLSQPNLSTATNKSIKEVILGKLDSTPVAGLGNALHFDGTNDYVEIPGHSRLRPSQVTLEAWIKAESWGAISLDNTIVGTDGSTFTGYVLRCGDNGILNFALGKPNNWYGANSGQVMSLNRWHHVAATFDGTNLTVYVDGNEENSTSPSGAGIGYVGNEDVSIGESLVNSGRNFHGTIDEVRIWNYARTQTDIQNNMRKTLDGDETGLVGYWRFDQTSGTEVHDSTLNLHHGTLNNMDSSNWINSKQSYTLTTNEEVSITVFAGYDLDGDSLTVTTISGPSNGTINFNQADNVLTYTPATNFVGIDEFTYQLSDGSNSDNYTIIINVANIAPTISSVSSQTSSSETISFTVSDSDYDLLTITAISSDPTIMPYTGINISGSESNMMTCSMSTNAYQTYTMTFSSDTNLYGLITISIIVSDSTGMTSSTDIPLIVSPQGSGIALDFDGTDDYVRLQQNYNWPSTLSIMAWVYLEDYVSVASIFSAAEVSGAASVAEFRIYQDKLEYLQDDNSVNAAITSNTTIEKNRWYHVAVVKEGSNVTLYVNGLVDNTGTLGNVPYPVNVAIGAFLRSGVPLAGYYYNGKIDEISFWSTPLSTTDIRNHMCKRLSRNETGLLYYYPFDHSSGTTLADLSGNENHGTLINMDNADWVTSGAAIGDVSVYDYTGSVASDFVSTLSYADGDTLTVVGSTGTYSGMQLYLVNTSPNVQSPPANDWSSIDSHYWGVFPIGSNTTYSIIYNYSGNSYVSTEINLSLAGRTNNSTTWYPTNAQLDIDDNTLSQSS